MFRSKRYKTVTELVRACQRLEPAAQTAFYDRYKKQLLGICTRYARTDAEAEDIFQEAFIKVFTHIGQLEKVESADGWVKSVVVRTAINYYHRTTKDENRQTVYEESSDDRESDDYANLISRFSQDEICAVINQLSDGYRLAINLYLIDGYSHAEIADLLGISESTSKSQLSRGRNALIKKLTQLGIHRYEKV